MITIPTDAAGRLARTTNPVLAALVSTHADYAQLSTPIDAAKATDADLAALDVSEATIRASIEERLAAGETVTDLPDLLQAQRAQAQAVHAAREMLKSIAITAARGRAEAMTDAVPAMLAALHEQVSATVDEARTIWPTAGHLTADEVAASTDTKIAAAYRQRLALEADYSNQRAAQVALLRYIAPELLETTSREGATVEVLHIANAAELEPRLALIQRYGADFDAAGRPTMKLVRPWPSADAPASAWLDYFATTPEATPWVPTPEQIDLTRQAQAEARRQLPTITDGTLTPESQYI